jgi:hypothetical protein
MSGQHNSQWKNIYKFLAEYMTPNNSYRAGNLYESFLAKQPIGIFEDPVVRRKDFEMCLRYEVAKENGFLKRVSHGVYAVRTDPLDRGVSFGRKKADPSNSLILPTEFTLDEVLDNSVEIAEKGKQYFSALENQEFPIPMQLELAKLKNAFMRDIDSVITNVTALMAWCEDNVEIGEEESSLTMEM